MSIDPWVDYCIDLNIIQSIKAGKASLTESQLDELVENVCIQLYCVIEKRVIEEAEANAWVELFTGLVQSKIVFEFCSAVDTDKFYSFGEMLAVLEDNKTPGIQSLIHEYLNVFRFSNFLKRIYNERRWDKLIERLIAAGNYNVSVLWNQRVRDYEEKILLRVLKGKDSESISWGEASNNIQIYGKSIAAQIESFGQHDIHVAFLMENSPLMAQLDIACLTSGIVNVMIPANSVPQHISYIMNETQAPLLFVADEKQLNKVKEVYNDMPALKKVVLCTGSSAESWVISMMEFLRDGKVYDGDISEVLLEKLKSESLATIMYTSGTTGEPKGIMFSQMNLVYKRFCRAMALPEIGEDDRYLSYLPLYHTFGRYLELMGAVFWAAEYMFMQDPSSQTMVENMANFKPTIFISIPKKWIQLYEQVSMRVDIEHDNIDKIAEEVKNVTGGKLKWGLSAAGFLPPEIFRFFQSYGIELMSGFGMTEATGGITMTPPQKYEQNSLGCALPGIEIKVASDGELLIRGSYVMIGYYHESHEETFKDGGWLPTGDIMRMDSKGFIEIIDRKKEIYKNIKGETIAPQRIENFFRDFENVQQVFLVGDHRLFNTLLIYPNYEAKKPSIKEMSESQVREYFSSLIVSVNKFLAPFESIVDFRLTDRPFSENFGELTPKGTYKRRIIENNFDSLIKEMYQKTYTEVMVGGIEVRLPNWFLREHGCLSGDVSSTEGYLELPKLGRRLAIEKVSGSKNLVRIGNYIYLCAKNYIELQHILIDSEQWVGNGQLFEFTQNSIIRWQRQPRKRGEVVYYSVYEPPNRTDESFDVVEKLLSSGEFSVEGLHNALVLLQSNSVEHKDAGLTYMKRAIENLDSPIAGLCWCYIGRPNIVSSYDFKRGLFDIVVLHGKPDEFYKYCNVYLEDYHEIIDSNSEQQIINSNKKPDKLGAIIKLVQDFTSRVTEVGQPEVIAAKSLIKLLSSYGIKHPSCYVKIRQELVKVQLEHELPEIKKFVITERERLLSGFREWLGENQKIAVDPETGEEYSWEDVIIFDEGLEENDRKVIQNVITNTPILRESVFLFFKRKIIRINDILPRGVWVSHLRNRPYKSVYRLTIQTRFQESFDIVFVVNKGIEPDYIREEVNLLILAGAQKSLADIVRGYGGYWPEYDIWSGEFVPGETVGKFLKREIGSQRLNIEVRLKELWPFFVWNASAANILFWKLSRYQYILRAPAINNFIIPPHDYQSGTKIVSLAIKLPFESLSGLFKRFYDEFIKVGEEIITYSPKKSIWNFVFAGVINALGQKEGVRILENYLSELESNEGNKENLELMDRLRAFIKIVNNGDYIPKQLYFAIKRFKRWYTINSQAALSAQAEMLNELYVTYRLDEIEEFYPEVRARLYMETVFNDSSEELKGMLHEIMEKYHTSVISKNEEISLLTKIPTEFILNEKEKFFITRLSFPHIKPKDSAELVEYKINGKASSNLVVECIDHEGIIFYIRNPFSPKEISKLHQIFMDANLLVTFRQEHQFLVAISERGYIIGGLFYHYTNSNTTHMEKIVVSNRYRRNGISDRLMNEFFERMVTESIEYVTTGFFRPEYFYKFGFQVERKYSGLVKKLEVKKVHAEE